MFLEIEACRGGRDSQFENHWSRALVPPCVLSWLVFCRAVIHHRASCSPDFNWCLRMQSQRVPLVSPLVCCSHHCSLQSHTVWMPSNHGYQVSSNRMQSLHLFPYVGIPYDTHSVGRYFYTNSIGLLMEHDANSRGEH